MGRPAPTVASVSSRRPAVSAAAASAPLSTRGPGERPLVGQHDVHAGRQRLPQQRRALVGGHVDQDGVGQRVLRQQRQRLRRRGRAPAGRLGQRAARFPCRRSGPRRRATTDQRDRTRSRGGRWPPPGRSAGAPLRAAPGRAALGQISRPARGRSARSPAAPRRCAARAPPRRRRSSTAGTRRGPRAGPPPLLGVDDERDVQLGRALRDGDDVDARLGQGREDAGGDAGVTGHADADDGDRGHAAAGLDAVDLAARDLARGTRRSGGRSACLAAESGTEKQIDCSDDDCEISDTLMSWRCSASNVRAAMPGTPSMPLPATVISA